MGVVNKYSTLNTQRFNVDWHSESINAHFFGLTHLIQDFIWYQSNGNWPPPRMKMLEIGSYMGESSFLFAASNAFDEIHCVEPFSGHEKFNYDNVYTWDFVYDEFKVNTRFFNSITLHKDYSYNVVNKFKDGYFDFIYIDANHTYEDVKRDIELYLPKLKKRGCIGGHDYYKEWPGVIRAVDDTLGEPDKIFKDTSWIKYEI